MLFGLQIELIKLNREKTELKIEIKKLREDLAEGSSAPSWDSQVTFDILCSLSLGRARFHFVQPRPLGSVVQRLHLCRF